MCRQAWLYTGGKGESLGSSRIRVKKSNQVFDSTLFDILTLDHSNFGSDQLAQ